VEQGLRRTAGAGLDLAWFGSEWTKMRLWCRQPRQTQPQRENT